MDLISDINKTVHRLAQKGVMICTAESCTGGLISKSVTDLNGSSSMFDRGFITYSNDAKMDQLDVPESLLNEYGSVSEQTAASMAQGALNHSNATIAISVTGIAGPSGGTDQKPIGLVYIGIATKKNITTKKFLFTGNRDTIRHKATYESLNFALESLNDHT